MTNIQLYSDNEDFRNDLVSQINHYTQAVITDSEPPDMIVIDDDVELYKEKRAEYPSVPILFLTAENRQTEDNLNVVVQKPFSLMRFLDTLRSANNKLDNSDEGFFVFNNYEMRPNQKKIVDLTTSEVVKLTEKEVSIIKYLYKRRFEFVGKTDLQINVWQYNENATTHTVETHIYRLRQKIESGGRRLILTENGKYKLKTD